MKNTVLFTILVSIFASSAPAGVSDIGSASTGSSSESSYVGTVNCKDDSGKVRISFHIDTTKTDSVPECIKQIKFDGEVANASIVRFDDDGPVYGGRNSANETYAAQLKFGLMNVIFGYTTEAVVQDVDTTLRCK